MASTDAQIKAVKKYQSGRDAIMLRPDKQTGAKIRQAAKDSGKSVSEFILDAVREQTGCI